MKKAMNLILCVLLSQVIFGQDRKDILQCDFSGTNINRIYYVTTRLGAHVIFELPEGKMIKHYIIGDPKLWKAESDGRIGIIKPIQAGISTTVSIITTDNLIFGFVLNEQAATGDRNYQKKVIISYYDDKPMVQKPERVERETYSSMGVSQEELLMNAEKTFSNVKTIFLKKLNMDYGIKKNKFKITRIFDDTIFTYIDMSKSQVRPACFIVNKNDKKKLEPVTFTDENGIYVLHRVLGNNEYLVLKYGSDSSRISKEG